MKHIQITDIPPGEAPERIRAAWVGVTIQLADIPEPQPSTWSTTGVLGRQHGLLARFKSLFGVPVVDQPNVTHAYVVDVIGAIESLRAQSPSAAAWWEHHTPHLLKLGKKFCFATSCCEEIRHAAA